MGEFGFITADDVYHVTVYATDENGNFKIISMKNIKLMKGPAPQPVTTTTTTTTTTTLKPFTVQTTTKSSPTTPGSSDDPSCASCRLPAKPDIETIKPETANNGGTIKDSSDIQPTPFKVVGKEGVTTENPQITTSAQVEPLPQKIILQTNVGNSISRFGEEGNVVKPTKTYNSASQVAPGDRQPNVNLPAEKLNAPQMFNNIGGNYNKAEKLMNGLLYRFNYTTDFQGHQEEGDRLGNKDGEYYSIGRDNIKRIVSYKANEFGFMPFIRQEQLRQDELQYYDERNNRLRGYEFKWFYPQ